MTRRHVLTHGVQLTAALALASRIEAAGSRAAAADACLTLFDPRFPNSRALAAALPGADRLTPVGGDPTTLLEHLCAADPRGPALALQGVTTESVPFCLEQYARGRHDTQLSSRRVDQDLFSWSLQRRPGAVLP